MTAVSTAAQQVINRVSAMSNGWELEVDLSSPPSITERKWSFMFRFPVLGEGLIPPALLVKIARMQGMSLEQAVSHPVLVDRTMREYKMLAAIEDVFSKPEKTAKGFVYIRPLAIIQDLNAIVMEELDCKPLKDYFLQLGVFPSKRKNDNFEFLLRRSSGWLREYHDDMAELQRIKLGEAGLQEKLASACRVLSQVVPGEYIEKIQKAILKAIESVVNFDIPLAMVHGDYHCSNIMVTPKNQVCSLDADFLHAPAYEDLAKFLIDLETRGLQTLLNGYFISPALVKRFQAVIVDVYFEGKTYNDLVLEIFITLALIYKWKIDEDVLRQSGKVQKIIRSFLAPWRRRYFTKLIGKRLENLKITSYDRAVGEAGGLS